LPYYEESEETQKNLLGFGQLRFILA